MDHPLGEGTQITVIIDGSNGLVWPAHVVSCVPTTDSPAEFYYTVLPYRFTNADGVASQCPIHNVPDFLIGD